MPALHSPLLRLLRERPAFRRLFLADAVTQVGEATLFIALPVLLLEATGDVTVTGLTFSGEILACGLLSPFAGYWADRLDQRRLMIGSNLVRVVLLGALLAVLGRHGSFLACLAVSTALGAVGSFFLPARSALLRRMLEGEELDCALASEGTVGFLIRLAAPAVVGLLLAFLPATSALVLDVGTDLAGAALLLPAWVRGRPLELPEREPPGAWRLGWRTILGSPALGQLLAADVLLSAVGMAAWSTTVAFLAEVLHRSPAENGWLMAATGLAGAVGTRVSGWLPRGRSLQAWLAGLVAATYLLVPGADTLQELLVLWMARGLAIGVFVVALNQGLARETPAEVMGRVQAAWGLAVCVAAFLGSLATPVLLTTVGAAGSFYAFGVAMALVAAWLGSRRD